MRGGRLLASIALLAVALEVSTRLLGLPIAPPSQIVSQAAEFVVRPEFSRSVVASLRRSATGFAVASLLAVPLGLLSGVIRQVEWLLHWVLALFRPMSPLAWIPLAIVWFGFTETATIFIVAYTVFFPVALNSMTAVENVPRIYKESALLLGADRMMITREVLWPSMIPSIVTGMRIGSQVALSVIVAAELIVGATLQVGLGYLLYYYSIQIFNLGHIITLAATLGVLGLAINLSFRSLQNWLTPWKPAEKAVFV